MLANAVDGKAAPQIRMLDLAADLVLGLGLLEELLVGGCVAHNVLDSTGVAGGELDGGVDLRARARTDLGGDAIARKLCERRFDPTGPPRVIGRLNP